MNITLSGRAAGVVQAPPSKSLAHRAVLAAALAAGESRVEGLEWSDDLRATLRAARAFGAQVRQEERGIAVRGCGMPAAPAAPVDCGESGSTLRFLAPILAQTGGEVANGVFVCFAPFEEPEIAVAIVIEKGGSGSALASSAVSILNAWFGAGDVGSAVLSENTLLP